MLHLSALTVVPHRFNYFVLFVDFAFVASEMNSPLSNAMSAIPLGPGPRHVHSPNQHASRNQHVSSTHESSNYSMSHGDIDIARQLAGCNGHPNTSNNFGTCAISQGSLDDKGGAQVRRPVASTGVQTRDYFLEPCGSPGLQLYPVACSWPNYQITLITLVTIMAAVAVILGSECWHYFRFD